MQMSEVVSAYIKYKKKREQIKERQRIELEELLEPYLLEFGEAIVEAQANGKRVADVEYEIGAKNRNLVYQAKRLANGKSRLTRPATPDSTPEADTEEPQAAQVQVLAVPGDGYEVHFDNTFKGTIWVTDEGLEIPEEWADDTDNSARYREAVRMVRDTLKE